MEEAEHALWRAAGLTIATAGEDVGYPRTGASCSFHAPLRFEDEFEVWIRVAEIGRRTMRYSCVLSRGETKLAVGTLGLVCVSKRKGEPMSAIDIPAEVRARFAVDPGADGT